MIIKLDKGNYYLVKSDSGKHIRIKGSERVYSEATELKDKPREYEEVEEWLGKLVVATKFIAKVVSH